MKYCPNCLNTYTDDTLQFCLQDGTGLLDSSNRSPMPTVDFSEKETVVRQAPITFGGQASRPTQNTAAISEVTKSKTIPAVIVTVLVTSILFGGFFVAWQMFGGNASENADGKNKSPSPTLTPMINRTPTTPDITERWQPIDYQASLNGERLTYYVGTTPEQCQADCDGNPNCRGFALIRKGTYNPQDPPMCYLLSKVTSSTVSSCCISGIKK